MQQPYHAEQGQQAQPPPSQRSEYQKITFVRDQRTACSWLLNILWILLGGWHMFTTWFLAGIALCCTCVGIPCGVQAIKISIFLLFPFGKSMVYTHDMLEDGGARCCLRSCNCFLNILWAVTVGWVLALQALLTGILLMLTIVGIPFGWQCFKLTYLCFRPFGVDFTAETEEVVFVNTGTPMPQYYAAGGRK